MDNLFLGIAPSRGIKDPKKVGCPGYPASRHPSGDQAFRSNLTTRFGLPEKVVNFRPKRLVIFLRNRWSISTETTGQFAPKYALVRLPIEEVSCYENPEWDFLRRAEGQRYTSRVDQDFCIAHLGKLLSKPTVPLSKVVWATMVNLPCKYLYASYRKTQAGGYRHSSSQLVHLLRDAAWIPQRDGQFVVPKNAISELMPQGFPLDRNTVWLNMLGFGEEALQRSEEEKKKEAVVMELGFADAKGLEDGRWFAKLDPDSRRRVKEEIERGHQFELPDQEPGNPDRRSSRVKEQAAGAPGRATERRMRSVQVGLDSVKQEAKEYLRHQYTNKDGETICQVCQKRLPFTLDDGNYYVEAVEFLPGLAKRHLQNYLALCPNHGAMYQHANGSRENLKGLFAEMGGNKLEIYLARESAIIHFTKTHIADLRDVIESDGEVAPDDGEGLNA